MQEIDIVYTMSYIIMEFEWDEEKYFANLLKHRIRFEDATEVWLDEYSIEFFDAKNSIEEERWIRLGYAKNTGFLTVVYAERGAKIRIISCRKSTKAERVYYERRV